MSIIKTLLKIITFAVLLIFAIGIVDYFLDQAGVIDIDHERLPEIIRPIFKN